jgi:P-type Ca2+ transporter type 2C
MSDSWATVAEVAQVLPPEQLLEALDVELEAGLSEAAAAHRLAIAGENSLSEAPPRSALAVLLAQFRSIFTLILVIAAIVSGLAGDLTDAFVILAVVVLNGVLGFYQEYRAEHSLLALRQMMPRSARVRRDGRIHEIPAQGVVPGDVLLIEAGERVAADGRIMLAAGLQIDESGLTGESAPIGKDVACSLVAETAIADRTNCAFMNTVVTRGRGELVVTATGMTTAMGGISRSLEATKEVRSPLQRQLDDVGRRLGLIALVLVALLFAISLARGQALAHVILESISLAVAAIPEGLPAVVTITLALGMRRMARKQALVKRLASVETLGCATVICSDKTGTLTVNEMTVRAFALGPVTFSVSGEGYETRGQITPAFTAENADTQCLFLKAAVLCNDSQLHGGAVIGDPTEGALLVLADKAGCDLGEIRADYPRLAEIPFDSAHKFMATAHRDGDHIHLFVKGAPDVLLDRCTSDLAEGADALDSATRDALLNQYSQFAAQGLRGLLLAHAQIPNANWDEGQFTAHGLGGLHVLGLVGIVDPARPEARDAIARCRRAGIAVKMITGDHPGTAAAIAHDLGLSGDILTGAELIALAPDELGERVERTAVFARVAPEHKVRIVQALQARGHIVAMTGDGVNDAPVRPGIAQVTADGVQRATGADGQDDPGRRSATLLDALARDLRAQAVRSPPI